MIRVLKFVGTFLVCLFTDPLQALVSLRDLWSDLLETVEEVVDFAQSLLDDVVEILDDIERLVDSLASSFGVVGAFFASVLKWALHMGRDLLGIVRDLTEGIQDVVFGILRLNWCRIASGGVEIGLQIARAVTWVTRIPFGLLGSARDSVTLHEVESEVDRALRRRFGDDEDALERARDRVGVGSRPMGLPMEVRPVRLFVSTESEVDLRDLHRDGVIDLYAMAGHASRCPGGPLDRPTGEVVYAGTDKTVSYRDIDLYLAEGPEAVAEFHAFAIRTDRFRRYLDTARRKAAQLGVQLWWKDIGAFEVHDRDYVPLDLRSEGPSAGDDTPPIGGERRNPVVEQLLADVYGRTGRDDPLCEVPLVAVFSYTEIRERQPFGFASWFRPPSFAGILGDDDDYEQVSGATFRDRQPYWPFQFVPIHEVGHYLGLDHANHETPDLIMMSPVDPNWISQRAIVEYLLLTGEPRFTLEDLRMTWRWVTEVADDACFG
ncbi:hypothetical protein ACFO0N_17375 [Halobium salinum]|uniref:Matrixin n=1 Tax=Halobium salinum TaxID=1364940 RepID=A0ABD5PGR5_9EURY|nr:hypothetical protein [Halobium salinum]